MLKYVSRRIEERVQGGVICPYNGDTYNGWCSKIDEARDGNVGVEIYVNSGKRLLKVDNNYVCQ